MDWIFIKRSNQTRTATGQSKIRAVHLDPRSRPNARAEAANFGLALHRRFAHGRSHAPTDSTLFRDVWRKPRKSGWRAPPTDPALEVWVQERQGNRKNQLHG